MSLLRNLVIWRSMPERARRWPVARWTEWLSESSRTFFLATDPGIRRRAFAPFSIEPVFSEVEYADQLFGEVRQNVPDAMPKFAKAALRVLARWRPQDGHELALFLLKLVYRFSGYVSEQLPEALKQLVKDLGPPLAASQILDILEEIVECAVSRLDTSDLRKLGIQIESRGNWGTVRIWQAQLLLLDAIIQKDPDSDVLADIDAIASTLAGIAMRNLSAKHFLADSIVDHLGLKGVAGLVDRRPSSDSEWRILGALQRCIFPYRVERQSGVLKDKKYPDRTYQFTRESERGVFRKASVGERMKTLGDELDLLLVVTNSWQQGSKYGT
jgi:hypothetical protein